MNPGTHHTATGPNRGKRGGDERADRCEQNRRIEILRWTLTGSAGPHGAQVSCKGLALAVAVSGEGEYAPALMSCDLRQEVRGGSEAVEAQVAGFPCLAIGAIADKTGAQQRCQLSGRHIVWQRQAVPRIRQYLLRVATIACVAGEPSLGAEVLEPGATVLAHAAGPGEPGNAHSIADGKASHITGARADHSDHLVSGSDGTADVGK